MARPRFTSNASPSNSDWFTGVMAASISWAVIYLVIVDVADAPAFRASALVVATSSASDA
jgi:hypothetical protein